MNNYTISFFQNEIGTDNEDINPLLTECYI